MPVDSKNPNYYQYQNVGFHFAVIFEGLEQGQDSIDARFQSVTGLEVQLETESIKEGGENRFEHVVPVRTKYTGLTLKRGLLTMGAGSALSRWCKSAFETFGYSDAIITNPKDAPVQPINLDVWLLDQEHNALAKWKVIHAWPKSWKFGELNAEKGEVLLETLELHYNRFEFVDPF